MRTMEADKGNDTRRAPRKTRQALVAIAAVATFAAGVIGDRLFLQSDGTDQSVDRESSYERGVEIQRLLNDPSANRSAVVTINRPARYPDTGGLNAGRTVPTDYQKDLIRLGNLPKGGVIDEAYAELLPDGTVQVNLVQKTFDYATPVLTDVPISEYGNHVHNSGSIWSPVCGTLSVVGNPGDDLRLQFIPMTPEQPDARELCAASIGVQAVRL